MASVTARVELHQATYTDYNTLHAAMQVEGFSRVVVASDSTRWQLPPGEYVHPNVSSPSDGRDRAAKAATNTGRQFSIFVAGWDGSWAGNYLPQV